MQLAGLHSRLEGGTAFPDLVLEQTLHRTRAPRTAVACPTAESERQTRMVPCRPLLLHVWTHGDLNGEASAREWT